MSTWKGQFDFLLDTIPVPHDFNPYLELLKRDATMCIVGEIGPTWELNTFPLIFARRRIAGSLIGGLAKTQEMLDFCGRHGIVSDIELIDMAYINDAYARIQRTASVHRRQDPPRRHLQAGRPIPPTPAGRRRHRLGVSGRRPASLLLSRPHLVRLPDRPDSRGRSRSGT